MWPTHSTTSTCRFERLKLKCLQKVVCAKYFELLDMFSEEVDRVHKVSSFHSALDVIDLHTHTHTLALLQ